ncbi:hypothetical protein [Qipengyuania sp. JC766]|uniref:hypothetical protein n=1 Tax=Qipengyuania sp. JC766 TaxID=3232139 RepID=UPI003459B18F
MTEPELPATGGRPPVPVAVPDAANDHAPDRAPAASCTPSPAPADPEPVWVAPFLAALRNGEGVRAAARIAGVVSSTPYQRRATHPGFREEWDAAAPVDGRRRRPGPAPRRQAQRIRWFLAELATTSNVAAAAAVAGLTTSRVYALRRTDPHFAQAWYAALAEGYDNLEMELLAHLRAGKSAQSGAGAGRGFDTATALRCLTAHRDNVAREKGRRTLAQEAATIQAINEKIDRLRENGADAAKELAKTRRAIARRRARP